MFRSNIYRPLLQNPLVVKLFLAATFARASIGIIPLAMILLISANLHSTVLAGFAAGVFALAGAVSIPMQGYLVDRLNHRTVMLPAILLHSSALAGLVIAIDLKSSTVLIILLAAFSGFACPSISPVLRSTWPNIFQERAFTQTAVALDAVVIELVFITGPLFVAGATALGSAAYALWLSIAFALFGGIWFVLLVPLQNQKTKTEKNYQRENPLRVQAIRVLLVCSFAMGIGLGSIEVLFTAFGVIHNSTEFVGIAMAALSIGSAVGGMIYSMFAAHRNTRQNYLVLITVLPVAFALFALAFSPLTLIILSLTIGFWLAPLAAAESDLTGQLVHDESSTEVYSWLLMSLVLGVATGSALSGVLASTLDWHMAVLSMAALMSGGTVWSWLSRKTIVPL